MNFGRQRRCHNFHFFLRLSVVVVVLLLLALLLDLVKGVGT
jgi:hypothetical protein